METLSSSFLRLVQDALALPICSLEPDVPPKSRCCIILSSRFPRLVQNALDLPVYRAFVATATILPGWSQPSRTGCPSKITLSYKYCWSYLRDWPPVTAIPAADLNSRLRELRIDYLIENGWGPQWRPESAEIFISGIFYGRQEVHKYFCTSVNINGRFTWYIIPRLLHIKKCTDRPTVAAPKFQPSEDEPPDH